MAPPSVASARAYREAQLPHRIIESSCALGFRRAREGETGDACELYFEHGWWKVRVTEQAPTGGWTVLYAPASATHTALASLRNTVVQKTAHTAFASLHNTRENVEGWL